MDHDPIHNGLDRVCRWIGGDKKVFKRHRKKQEKAKNEKQRKHSDKDDGDSDNNNNNNRSLHYAQIGKVPLQLRTGDSRYHYSQGPTSGLLTQRPARSYSAGTVYGHGPQGPVGIKRPCNSGTPRGSPQSSRDRVHHDPQMAASLPACPGVVSGASRPEAFRESHPRLSTQNSVQSVPSSGSRHQSQRTSSSASQSSDHHGSSRRSHTGSNSGDPARCQVTNLAPTARVPTELWQLGDNNRTYIEGMVPEEEFEEERRRRSSGKSGSAGPKDSSKQLRR